jgi:hypothetical protein
MIDDLPIILPLLAVQLILVLVALSHVLRHPHYRFGSKAMWIVVILVFNLLGAIFYFVFGRGEEE